MKESKDLNFLEQFESKLAPTPSFVLTETPNLKELYRSLVHSPTLFKSQKPLQVLEYIKKAEINHGKTKTYYFDSLVGKHLKENFPQFFANGDGTTQHEYRVHAKELSWSTFTKDFRNAAHFGMVTNPDFEKSNWRILVNAINCEVAQDFVDNRTQWYNEAMHHYEIEDRALIKELFIRIQFLGTEEGWREAYAPQISTPFPKLQLFEAALKKYTQHLRCSCPDELKYFTEINKTKKKA